MARNSAGIPEPFDFRFWAIVLFTFVGLPAIIAAAVWWRWFAPCSWWAGSALQDVPLRCVEELRR